MRIASAGEHGTHQIVRELRRDTISIEALEASFGIMLRTAGCGRQAPQCGEALFARIVGLDITQMLSQVSLQLARLRLRIAEAIGEVAAD